MKYNRPIVLSIAGFDPTGGAGVLADLKTIEQHKCLGMAVQTANTVQTEDEFSSVEWFTEEKVLQQLNAILDNYAIAAVKIGIVQDLNALKAILSDVKQGFDGPIVWDPVLAASTGFVLHDSWNFDVLCEVLKQVTLITPNIQEVRQLTGVKDEMEAAFLLANHTNVLLKGGHSSVRQGIDFLIENGVPSEIRSEEVLECTPKHGSGCILSAAIAANLALGNTLKDSCFLAKQYIEQCLSSNPNLLSYHVR